MTHYWEDSVIVRDSIASDVDYLKDKLRYSDVREIWRSHNHTPEDALKISLDKSSVCLTIFINKIPVGMFGINPETLLGDKAIIWLLATDDILKIKIRFLRNCKKFINFILKDYSVLYNYVDNDNVDSIKWLKFIGAKVHDPVEYGVEKMPFRLFLFERKT